MQWATKNQEISKITTQVEVNLLYQAVSKQPNNSRVFSKLIDALIFQNKIQSAIELSQSHLEINAVACIALAKLFKMRGEYESIIAITQSCATIKHSTEFKLHLAYAYAKTYRLKEAKELLSSLTGYVSLKPDCRRLAFSTLLLLDDFETITNIYHSLPAALQIDSDLTLSYLKSAHQQNHNNVVKSLLNYAGKIKQYSLSELGNHGDVSAINDELTEFITSHPKQQYEPSNHATRYGSRLHFEQHWHASLEKIAQCIKVAISHYINDQKLSIDFPVELNMWATTMQKKGHQISHIHPNGILSGVYYVHLPTDNQYEQKFGLKLIQSQEISTDTATSFNEAGDLIFKQEESTTVCRVKPEEGLFVLFPSYFYHQTNPVDVDEMRISIAFDMVKSIK